MHVSMPSNMPSKKFHHDNSDIWGRNILDSWAANRMMKLCQETSHKGWMATQLNLDKKFLETINIQPHHCL